MRPQRLDSSLLLFGLLGCVLLPFCSAMAAWGYVGKAGENYSLLNHFISELGWRGVTPAAAWFNGGLIAGSICLLLFAFSFWKNFFGRGRLWVLAVSLITSLACLCVGLLPMDLLWPHLRAAMVFFHAALVLVLLSSFLILRNGKSNLPKWLGWLGALPAACFAAFVLWPKDSIRSWIQNPKAFIRPEIWALPIWEWACFFSIIGWLIVAIIVLLRRQNLGRGN